MGASYSSPRLQIPLCAQPKPFLATNEGRVSETFTTLRFKVAAIGSSVKVFDTRTGKLLYRLKSSVFSRRQRLLAPDRRVLMSIKSPLLQSGEHVYAGDQTDTESFRIDYQYAPSLIYTQFYDVLSGELCRVVVDGDCDDLVVNVYLERGYPANPQYNVRAPAMMPVYQQNLGDPTAAPVCVQMPQSATHFQAVGRIRANDSLMLTGDVYFIDAAPGIDITLLLLLCAVRHGLEVERRMMERSRHR